MSSIYVLKQFAAYADYFIASEDTEPAHGKAVHADDIRLNPPPVC